MLVIKIIFRSKGRRIKNDLTKEESSRAYMFYALSIFSKSLQTV